MEAKKVSIVIPVYNEEKTIALIVKRVLKSNTLGIKKEIIIVDDGSKDKTRIILKRIKNKQIRVILHKKNKGKGAALRTGFQYTTGDIVLIQDADLEYNPNEIQFLLEPIVEKEADVVYGSRFISYRPHRVLYFWHSVGNSLLTFLSNAVTNLNLTDIETGYKVFRRDIVTKILPNLTSDGFEIEPEITAQVAKLSKRGLCNIYEVGISYHGRTYSEGKKINWKDGFAAIWYIIKFNLFS